MAGPERVPQHLGADLGEHVLDQRGGAALAHLLATGDGHQAVVQPVLGEAVPGALRLRPLVLVVREDQVDATGVQAITTVHEVILVKGSADEQLQVRNTRYGPIVAKDSVGNELALAWVAHRPGGVDANALHKPKRFFGAARNVEGGGSLTIIATALIDTGSRMDEVIFEEFKGTGNMEVRLDRELAERRVYPAIHIPQSGTRNDDRLYHPDEFLKVIDIRKQLAQQPIGDAIETLLTNLRATKTNAELLLRGLR